MSHDVKCGGCKILPLFQVNNLACHSCMDTGKRQEPLGSETKDFITHSNRSSQSISIFWCPSLKSQFPPKRWHKEAKMAPAQQGAVWQEGDPELNKPKSFIMGSKPVWPLPQKETQSSLKLDNKCAWSLLWREKLYRPRLFAIQIILEKPDQNKGSLCRNKRHMENCVSALE